MRYDPYSRTYTLGDGSIISSAEMAMGAYLKPKLPPDSELITAEVFGCPTDFLISKKYDAEKKAHTITVTTILPAISVRVDHLAASPPARYPWKNL